MVIYLLCSLIALICGLLMMYEHGEYDSTDVFYLFIFTIGSLLSLIWLSVILFLQIRDKK